MKDQPSDKPLVEKLGFAPGDTVFVEDTPGWYSTFSMSNGLELIAGPPATHAHIFCDSRATLQDFLDSYDLEDIEKSIWFSWPKKASKVKTDLTEQTFRDLVLPLGWVDTKVAAVDDTWSGLKFLRRKA